MLDMPDIASVRITRKEIDEFDNVMKTSGYRCDDDWVPTLREVEDKIIARYQLIAKKKYEFILASAQAGSKPPNTADYDRDMKSLMLFMRWILNTCDTMGEDARNRLDKFVAEKITIIEG